VEFERTSLPDAWLITPEPAGDERGFFSRIFCRKEFEARGIDSDVAQCNVSFNKSAGTLRGMHYQDAPAAETKLISCTHGAIYDVIVDVRPHSRTYLQHFSVELTAKNRKMLLAPRNFAHGFLTLAPNTQVFYIISEFYAPDCQRGLRFDDPALAIEWPKLVKVISDKDKSWPLLKDREL